MSIQHFIEQAKEVAATGDTNTAIALLRQAITQEPQNVDAWLTLADTVKEPEQAQQCLERVIKIDPNNQIARQKLYGEQPDWLDFPFEDADEPIQEPEEVRQDTPSLDFSNLYNQENQPPQSHLEPDQLYQHFEERRKSQKQVSPSVPPPAPPAGERRPQTPPKRRPSEKRSAQKKKNGLSKIEIVLIGMIGFICLCLAVLGFAYIGNSGVLNPQPTDLPDDVTAVIYENIRASNTKDMDRYMGTIHSRSPVYNSTKKGVEEAFSDQFTLSYRVSDVYIIEQSNDRATVHFVLTTRLVSGPISFRDNRVTGEMALRKEDGAWKIYNQKVDNVEYLD